MYYFQEGLVITALISRPSRGVDTIQFCHKSQQTTADTAKKWVPMHMVPVLADRGVCYSLLILHFITSLYFIQ
jgi:hypothetical protein